MKESKRATEIVRCFYERNIEKAGVLISMLKDVNVQDERGRQLLTESVYTEDIHIVQALLNRGARVNMENVVDGPVWAACRIGNVEILDLLVSAGAQLNVRDSDERTPIYLAVSRNHQHVVDYLLTHGAFLDKTTLIKYPNVYDGIAM